MSCLTFSVTSSSSACGSTSLPTFLAAILVEETFSEAALTAEVLLFLPVEAFSFAGLAGLLVLDFELALAVLVAFAADLVVPFLVLEAVDLEVLLFVAFVVEVFLFVVGMLWDGL